MPGGGLAKHRHHRGVRVVDAGKLHVVGQDVRRHAVQNQLARVRVLALVALERNRRQSQDGRSTTRPIVTSAITASPTFVSHRTWASDSPGVFVADSADCVRPERRLL